MAGRYFLTKLFLVDVGGHVQRSFLFFVEGVSFFLCESLVMQEADGFSRRETLLGFRQSHDLSHVEVLLGLSTVSWCTEFVGETDVLPRELGILGRIFWNTPNGLGKHG